MTTIRLTASNMAYKGSGKPYIAKILGHDAKTNYDREFLPRTATITKTGLYEVCNYDKKDRKDVDFYVIVNFEDNLHKLLIGQNTLDEILQSDKSVDDLIIRRKNDGNLTFRVGETKDTAIAWRSETATDLASMQEEHAKLSARLKELETEMAMYIQQP